MERIAKIGDYMTVPECATMGTVKGVKESRQDTAQDQMLIYEIETVQGMMRLPADWQERLIDPA